ncbi:MAG: MogA/MoaB family molybdenum cofactor biosynthesis protein [Methanoregulaceae archaeon]|nr:MogA/MoaB family molybdenum cofactor biosynthesis protein [Methanoregulaceae archaeon]
MKPEHLKEFEIVAAIITVSSTRTADTDSSGRIIQDLLKEAGIQIGRYSIVPDRIPEIRNEAALALQAASFVIFNGGTGLTHDDCTIEAIAPFLEKTIDGFGELFRQKSYSEIGTAAVLSRALAGVTGGKAIFCIPGSNAAVRLATAELIIPEIRHILSHARS